MLSKINYNKPFAIINQGKVAKIFSGQLKKINLLNQIDNKTINIIPYSQIKEKNYQFIGEALPILSLNIETELEVSKEELYTLSSEKIELENNITTNLNDAEYTNIVDQIINNEIKNGEGPDFVISRQFYTKIKDFNIYKAFELFKNLLLNEENSYMTFIFYDGEQYFVGASPEIHLKVNNGQAQMNPISGSLPRSQISQINEFLKDKKEISELFQVVDEVLKMMCVICKNGGKIDGPYLKEMNSVLHTEYYLIGETNMNPIDALRISLYSCTVTGAPVENACRIISKYENKPRRYYAGVIAYKDQNYLDSAILIRTVEIDKYGNVKLQVGATIVEDSVPAKKTIETNAKVEGMLKALKGNVSKFKPYLEKVDLQLLNPNFHLLIN